MFKPMLAGKAPEASKVRYPVLVSPKLDGVRVIVQNGVVMSRNMKPIPNARVQRQFGRVRFNNLDGELIVGAATDSDAFRNTTSGVMTRTGEPDVFFHVFDYVEIARTYIQRRTRFQEIVDGANMENLLAVEHDTVKDALELHMHEEWYLERGYEGLMIRDPLGHYKFGRSTTNEGGLLKLKQFEDSEAVVHGYEEQMHNANEQQRDELGRSKRTSHKEGMVPTGVLGALCVQDIRTGVKFNIGSGFSEADRNIFWRNRKTLVGMVAKYRFFPTGSKEKPRFPTFIGFRDKLDM